MTKISFSRILATCTLALVLGSCKQVADKNIVIYYENDVHCTIEGYAKIAGLKAATSDTAYAGIVSCGDYLNGGTLGAISHGQYVIDVMKHVGYDAVALGNHEFDFTVPVMESLLNQIGRDKVTCVNLVDMGGTQVFNEYIIKEYGKKKVAFIGATTPTTLSTEAYSFYDKNGTQLYDFAPEKIYGLIQNAVDKARKDGADYVVVLSHLGDDPTYLNIDSHGLIKQTNGIDVVLDGHTHYVKPCVMVENKDGKPIPITQTGTKFETIGKLTIDKEGIITTELIPTKDLMITNADVQAAIDSVLADADNLIKRPICKSDVDLRILDEKGYQLVRIIETNAGDLVADAFYEVSGADIAATNGGGIRSELKAGDLTYGDIVSLLPYENTVQVVEITGKQLVELLKACTQFLPVKHGDFPQVAGIKFTVNVGKPDAITNLVVLDKKTNEYVPVDMDKTYTFATTDYCITGGGFQGVLKNNKVIKSNVCLYSDALIKFTTGNLGGHIGSEYANPTGQGRITIKY